MDEMDALMVMLMRIYDMAAVVANAVDPVAADSVVEMHKNGEFFSPPPSYRVPVKEE